MGSNIISILKYPHVGMLVLSWFIGLLIFPWLIRLSRRIGAVDRPREYKSHAEPTSFLGGVGIFVAFAITIFSTLRLSDIGPEETVFTHIFSTGFRQLMGIVVGGFFVMVLGLLDDFRPINAIFKLILLFLATLVLYYFGIRLTLFPDGDRLVFEGLNVMLTLLWIVGVTSALNSLDNMDGASGGVSAVAAVFIFIVAWGTSAETAQYWLSFAAIALLGGVLAFLRYNWSPARIFLGDNGSFMLGFLLASILVMGEWSTSPFKSIIIPCIILTVPLYDITISTILRLKNRVVKGKNFFQTVKGCILFCGHDHITHRLVALGLHKKQAVIFLYVMGVVCGVIALVIRELENPLHVVLVLLIYLLAFFFLAVKLDGAHIPDKTSSDE